MNDYTVSSDKPFPDEDPDIPINRHERRRDVGKQNARRNESKKRGRGK